MKHRVRVAAIIVREGRVLAHEAAGRDGLYHALPGGKLEPGEAADECLRRELLEEFAAEIAVGRLLYVAEGWWLDGKRGDKPRHELALYYLARLADPGAAIRSREPRIAAAWLDLRDGLGRLLPGWLRGELARRAAEDWAGPARLVSADERPAPARPLAISDLGA
ncbi:MAG TPA: NUDIX domain-containing protein [Herpetosiphonaceae bacterium]